MITQTIRETEICPACDGQRVQTNNDGIRVLCPACGGSGVIAKPAPMPVQPYSAPIWIAPPWQPYCHTQCGLLPTGGLV